MRSLALPWARARDTSSEPDAVNARFLRRSPSSSPLSSSKNSLKSELPGVTFRKYCSMASCSIVKPVFFFCTSWLIRLCSAFIEGIFFSGLASNILFRFASASSFFAPPSVAKSGPYHSRNNLAFWLGLAAPR